MHAAEGGDEACKLVSGGKGTTATRLIKRTSWLTCHFTAGRAERHQPLDRAPPRGAVPGCMYALHLYTQVSVRAAQEYSPG